MSHMIRRIGWSSVALAALIVLGVALRLAVFGVSVQAIPAFDDECKIALQAKQIARGEFALLILASPYIFPLDAYVMAPFIHLLPRDAFGARIIAFVFGLLTLGLSLLILRRWGPLRDTWPGLLLVLFGSTYLLALQNGCALPGYYTLLFLSAFTVWLAQRQAASERRPWAAALAAGLTGGLACSETMLSLPVLLAAGAMLGLHRGWRTARWAVPALALGALVGLLPHLAAKHLHPDAFSSVQQSITLQAAAGKFLSPVMDRTLPAALGIAPPVFPDTKERVGWLAHRGLWFSGIWALVLTAATILAATRGVRRWLRDRWPSLDDGMVFAGISWMCLGLFLLSGRSHSHTYRYFAPIAWCFPFLVGYLYAGASRPWRMLLGALTVALVAVNLANSAALVKRWAAPGFADDLKSYDLRPAIDYLDSRGIRHGYATYVDAYRFTLATDERLIVCQPFNERFPGWLVPYKEVVDAADRTAYILSDAYRFPPRRLEEDMAEMGVKSSKQVCGHYTVFTDFVCPERSTGVPIPRTSMTASASHNANAAPDLIDGTVARFWRCEGTLQQTGMWVAVEWEDPAAVTRIRLDHGMVGRDHARRVKVWARDGGTWTPAADSVPDAPAPFEFRNNRPAYGRAVTEIVLSNAVAATGVKVEILEPRTNRAWTVNEVEIIRAE